MGRWWSDLNGTVRGFIIILAIATVVFVLNLEGTLISLSLLLQIVFFLAIAVVGYMFWRDRMRHDIETWSDRSRRVFYGSFALVLVDLGVFFWPGRTTTGLDAFAFIGTLILAGYAMWRVWRSERSYGY
jgi:nicotinamide riboside transporter PnuC